MQERLKTKSLQISVFRLDPRRSLTSPSAVISNRFTDRNKIDRTLLPCKKFWLGAAAVSYLTMSMDSVLIWFPSDNNKKEKKNLTLCNVWQLLNGLECFWCGTEKSCAAVRRERKGKLCVPSDREIFFFFGLLDVAALTPAGTLAALGRLCGTPWRESAGTASRTSWWEPSERLEHRTKTTMSGGKKKLSRNSGGSAFSNCVIHFF